MSDVLKPTRIERAYVFQPNDFWYLSVEGLSWDEECKAFELAETLDPGSQLVPSTEDGLLNIYVRPHGCQRAKFVCTIDSQGHIGKVPKKSTTMRSVSEASDYERKRAPHSSRPNARDVRKRHEQRASQVTQRASQRADAKRKLGTVVLVPPTEMSGMQLLVGERWRGVGSELNAWCGGS